MRWSLGICLAIFVIFGVDSHNWNLLSGGYFSPQQHLQNLRYGGTPRFQSRQAQQPEYEIFKGTIDQLGEINAQWICTNQKTGDMIVIGTDDVNPGTNRYPGQNNVRPQYPQYPQQQVPQYPQQQVPQYPQQQLPQNPQQQLPQNPQIQLPQNPQIQLPQNPQQQLPQNPQQQLPQNPHGQQQQQEPPKNSGFPELPWTVLPGNGASAQTTTADPFKNFDWTSYVTTTPNTMTSRHISESEINGEGLIEPRMGMRG